ncbi:MAG: hypothetical protein ABI389_12510 [Rhodanobacter sp.]
MKALRRRVLLLVCIRSRRCIGDAKAPGLLAHAVYAGHRYARELEEPVSGEAPFKLHFHVG